MKETVCVCVLLIGLAGYQGGPSMSYVPTVAVAAAATEAAPPVVSGPITLGLDSGPATCKNGQCGSSKPRATIKRSTRRPRRVFRLFRGRRR